MYRNMVVKVEQGYSLQISVTRLSEGAPILSFHHSDSKQEYETVTIFQLLMREASLSKAQITGGDLTMSEVLPTFDP